MSRVAYLPRFAMAPIGLLPRICFALGLAAIAFVTILLIVSPSALLATLLLIHGRTCMPTKCVHAVGAQADWRTVVRRTWCNITGSAFLGSPCLGSHLRIIGCASLLKKLMIKSATGIIDIEINVGTPTPRSTKVQRLDVPLAARSDHSLRQTSSYT